jgi:DNA replication protein DnaC
VAELLTERIRSNARELKLLGLAEAADSLIERAEQAALGYREFLDLCLEEEVGVLEGRRYASRLKLSALPHHKTLDSFDPSFQPGLDPKRLGELRTLRFLERRVSLLLFGPPGVGKSHIAVGLGMEALRQGYLIRYTTLDDLVRSLREADALGKLSQKLAHHQRPQLLILDEAGFLPLERADANRLFQVVNRRYQRGSTIVTSNKSVSEWGELLGDEVLAAAILDRLLHDAEVLTINGPSYRLRGRLEDCARVSHRTQRVPNDPTFGPRRLLRGAQIASQQLGSSAEAPGERFRGADRPRQARRGRRREPQRGGGSLGSRARRPPRPTFFAVHRPAFFGGA